MKMKVSFSKNLLQDFTFENNFPPFFRSNRKSDVSIIFLSSLKITVLCVISGENPPATLTK